MNEPIMQRIGGTVATGTVLFLTAECHVAVYVLNALLLGNRKESGEDEARDEDAPLGSRGSMMD